MFAKVDIAKNTMKLGDDVEDTLKQSVNNEL